MPRRKSPLPPLGLVLVRIVVGVLFLKQGWRWVEAGTLDGDDIRAAVQAASGELARPLAWWGREVLLANPEASALFWRWGALVVGLALVAGVLVRPMGTLGALFLAQGVVYGAPADVRLFVVLGACALACALADAGDRLGLDGALVGRLPEWLSWRRGRDASPFL